MHIIELDMTKMDTFQRCGELLNLRFNRDLTTQTKNIYLDAGDLTHVGTERYYNALKQGQHYDDAVHEMLIAIDTRAALESDLPDYEVTHIKRVLELYCDHWRVEDQGWKIDFIEEPFSYVLYEDDTFRIQFSGKIDLIKTDFRYTNLPVDTKTFRKDFEVLRMNNQFINYAIATNSNWLMVNRIGLHELDTSKQKPLHERFKRIMLSYDDVYKEQWKRNMIIWAMKYWDSLSTNTWELNFAGCFAYGRKCDFYDVCDTSGQEAKAFKLKDFKIGEKWDVAKPLGTRK